MHFDPAKRIAANIHNLSVTEESALLQSESLRRRVISAFKDLHGEQSELTFEVKPNHLQCFWRKGP